MGSRITHFEQGRKLFCNHTMRTRSSWKIYICCLTTGLPNPYLNHVFLNENTISLQSYFVKWLCTHSFGSMACSWKRIFILKSSNMMNWCSHSFLGAMLLSRHWCSTRDMRKNKETSCNLQCEWLYLNKVHICFCKLESQNNIHKCPGVTPDPLPSWLTNLWKILRQK